MATCVERRAACGASYNACASGATPCKFETRQPARPAGKATADRQFQRRVRRRRATSVREIPLQQSRHTSENYRQSGEHTLLRFSEPLDDQNNRLLKCGTIAREIIAIITK